MLDGDWSSDVCSSDLSQGTEIVQRILLSYIEKGFDSTSLSIGLIACKRDKNMPRLENDMVLKERADKAMYEAKKGGKNCVVTRI
jgi:GGDEF domain-containing protein